MKTQLTWTANMEFQATADGLTTQMDAKKPIGHGTAMTPKELVAAGLGGCTAMDVVALLKKHKQNFKAFTVDVDITTSTGGQPVIFTSGHITFTVTGNVDPQILLEAAHLSQTKYCGVSAMLVKAFPITYEINLNGKTIGTGKAEFT